MARARAEPAAFVIGIDASAAAMAEASRRAARPAARGGVANALFVVAAAERPPIELLGIADEVTINFPWGSLLRGALAMRRRGCPRNRGAAEAGCRSERPRFDHGSRRPRAAVDGRAWRRRTNSPIVGPTTASTLFRSAPPRRPTWRRHVRAGPGASGSVGRGRRGRIVLRRNDPNEPNDDLGRAG